MKICGARGQLLERIEGFYREACGSVRMQEELSDSFVIGVGMRQECVISPWLFNIF